MGRTSQQGPLLSQRALGPSVRASWGPSLGALGYGQAGPLGLRLRPSASRTQGPQAGWPLGSHPGPHLGPLSLSPSVPTPTQQPAPAHVVGAVDMAFLFDFVLPRLQQLGVERGEAWPCVVELWKQAGTRVSPRGRGRATPTALWRPSAVPSAGRPSPREVSRWPGPRGQGHHRGLHAEAQKSGLTRAVSGTRSSFIRRLVQSRASSSSAISCRWNTATWADVRRMRPLGVRSTPNRSSAAGGLSWGSSGGCGAQRPR